MISESEAVRRVVGVCPGFQDVWRQHLNFARDEGEYIHINVLADWVVDQVAADNRECLPELFAEVDASWTAHRLMSGTSCDRAARRHPTLCARQAGTETWVRSGRRPRLTRPTVTEGVVRADRPVLGHVRAGPLAVVTGRQHLVRV